MLKPSSNKLSFYACGIISIIILIYHFTLPYYHDRFFTSELSWDIFSYYLYLPLTFIYGDLPISDYHIIQHIFDVYNPSGTFYQAFQLPNGHYVINYMCGFAILQLPFFLIGHIWAHLGGYATDGFSFPYQFAVSTGVYVYILGGLYGFRKLLLRYFNDNITTLVIIFMLLGTNYFNEATRANLMPHAIMFGVVTLLINKIIDWFQKPDRTNSILVGVVFTLAVLSRPSEILLGIFPLLYGIKNKADIIKRFQFFVTNFRSLLLIIVTALALCIPQFIYWKIVTGSFVFFSYQNTEGFNFFEPHIIESLFSFKNSWFIYTPLIIFPLIGFISLYKKNRDIFLAIFVFVIVNFYVLSCWLAWWNGGGFGMRYFVESYVLLGIPFGYLLTSVVSGNAFKKFLVFALLILLTAWNQFETWQFAHYIMPHDGRNMKFYKAAMFDTSIKEEHTRLMDIYRAYGPTDSLTNEVDYTKKTIAYYNFSDVNSTPIDFSHIDTSLFVSMPSSFRMDSTVEYSPGIRLPFNQITGNDHAWIRASVNFFPVDSIKNNPATLVITMKYQGRNFYYKGFELDRRPYELNKWNKIEVEYLTPYPFSVKNEYLECYIWYRGKKPMYIDDFHIQALERKY